MSNEKQESVANNAAAMREALEAAHRTLKLVYENAVEFIQPRLADEIIHTGSAIESALAAPPRNCDMGTAEEQDKRFSYMFCRVGVDGCEKCKLNVLKHRGNTCGIHWAQMPYEEGREK